MVVKKSVTPHRQPATTTTTTFDRNIDTKSVSIFTPSSNRTIEDKTETCRLKSCYGMSTHVAGLFTVAKTPIVFANCSNKLHLANKYFSAAFGMHVQEWPENVAPHDKNHPDHSISSKSTMALLRNSFTQHNCDFFTSNFVSSFYFYRSSVHIALFIEADLCSCWRTIMLTKQVVPKSLTTF